LKKFSAAVFALALTLAACSAQGEPAELPEFLNAAYRFTAGYSADGLSGELVFTKSGLEECEIEFLSPDTIKGLVVSLKSGAASAEFHGIKYEGNISDFPQFSPAISLYNILSGKGGDAKATKDRETGNTVYEFEDGSQLVTDAEGLKAISIPSMGIELTITDFELL
jgi:hypothetical protein